MKRLMSPWSLAGLGWVLAGIACIHLFGISDAPVADDAYFAKMLSQYSLGDYLIHRYHTWTGRLPIEGLLVVLVHHTWIWRACNAVLMALLIVATARLARVGTALSQGGAMALVFALFMLITPQIQFESSRWLTGSLNYLWPAALGLWSLVPLVEGKAYGWPQRLGFCLAASLAAYCDQLALALVPLALGLLIWRARQGRATRWDIAQALLLVANAAFALSAPGNAQRFHEEQGMRFPNFADLDVLEKLRIGLGLIARAFSDPYNYLVELLGVLVLVLLWRAPLSRWLKGVLGAVLVVSLAQVALVLTPLSGHALRAWLPMRLDGDVVFFAGNYAVTAWTLFSVGCLMIACACCFWRSTSEALRMLGVLLLGLASLGMMGFSPTAYLSSMRIAFLCAMALVIVGTRLFARLPQVYGPGMSRALVAVTLLLASWRIVALCLA
ncbi:hypothetical protein SAMN05428989_0372 [Pseudoxanthomonas sp. GM95]|uniref:DUF6056 family protein n=1 Tax=Pseudoxanthomonas sp. GM95 TaxID=1881043 RepID=UPI0008CEFB32|nr:DUF6056 family protein [Pseudoxanthomonas sp. GM95]SEK57137.1 hypothetical protein SAMN05428989_0372 [Pseudoxanthomonas sp. GM95]